MQHTVSFPRRAGQAVALAAGVLLTAMPMAALSQASVSMDSAPVQRCRTIDQAAARLACYDAIALPGLGSRAGWGAPVGPAAAAAAAGASAGAAPAGPADGFGLETRSGQPAPERLESRIAGSFDGWEPNTRFTLENGQVWQVVDGSRAYYRPMSQLKAVVSRGLLGSFYLQIEGVNRTPRVRRVE